MTSRTLSALLAAVVLTACGSDAAQRIDAPATGAYVKFYNVAINAPGVDFYANNVKLTGVVPPSGVAVDTTGTKYGSLGNAGLYSALTTGSATLAAKPSSPSFNGASIGSVSASLVDGKYYSFFLGGFYNTTTKQADAWVIEDAFPTTIDFNVTTVRFVNASPNSQPMQLIARDSVTKLETPVGGPVAYKAATPFVTYPPALYTMIVRAPNSSTNLITRAGVSMTGGKVYTITARGDMTVTSTTATNRPFLDNTANR